MHIQGLENIPKDKPLLFVCNHSSSFLDGMVLASMKWHKLFALARGDAFSKPIPNRILRSMCLLPIYRVGDAAAEKARNGNQKTFDESYQLFVEGKRLLIFPEAVSHPEKTLRPLKKGAANLIADVLSRSEGKIDLHLVPCAINYSAFSTTRIRVQTVFDTAVPLRQYWDEIKQDKRKFGVRYTEVIQEKLSALIVKTSGDLMEEKDFGHEIALNEMDEQRGFKQYGSRLNPAAMVDAITAENADEFMQYKISLEQEGFDDRTVKGGRLNILAVLIALLTFGVSLPAALLYKAFWMLSKVLTDRIVKNPLFYDSAHFGIAYVFTALWIGLLFIAAFVFTPDSWHVGWKLLTWVIAMFSAFSWFTAIEEWKAFYLQLKWMGRHSALRKKLKAQRENLIKKMSAGLS